MRALLLYQEERKMGTRTANRHVRFNFTSPEKWLCKRNIIKRINILCSIQPAWQQSKGLAKRLWLHSHHISFSSVRFQSLDHLYRTEIRKHLPQTLLLFDFFTPIIDRMFTNLSYWMCAWVCAFTAYICVWLYLILLSIGGTHWNWDRNSEHCSWTTNSKWPKTK